MRKMAKRILVPMLALVLVFTSMAAPVKAAEGEYLVFIALGADSNDGSWDISYAGPDTAGNTSNVTAVTAMAKDGDTVTVSLTVPTVKYTWYVAPCVIIDPTTLGANAHFDVSLKIDGVDKTNLINFAADDVNFWSENAGDYPATSCIRLAGGYNEWGTKYIDSPSGFTTIEYTITLNLDLPASATTTDAVPTTGDNNFVYLVAAFAVVSVAGIIVTRKKNFEA